MGCRSGESPRQTHGLIEQKEIRDHNRRGKCVDGNAIRVKYGIRRRWSQTQAHLGSHASAVCPGWTGKVSQHAIGLRIVADCFRLRTKFEQPLLRGEPQITAAVVSNPLNEITRQTFLGGETFE